MQVGRRILFNKKTGEIICDLGEMEGAVLPREPINEGSGDIGVIDFHFGAYSTKFKKMTSVKVDIQTRELIFELVTE